MASRRLQITLQPAVLRWARERVPLTEEELAGKLHVKPERIREWEQTGKISFAEADNLARCTYTPVGFLWLKEPPKMKLPIADFRTLNDRLPRRPSPDLIETVYLMQHRQAWMRDEWIEYGVEPLDFVGKYGLGASPSPLQVAAKMREALGLAEGWAAAKVSWTAALGHLRDVIEAAGVLVVFNGIVGNNTHRRLNPDEFQGFALVDEYAPLIFVNAADFKAAQMFTLAHELAHIFIGATGLSALVKLDSGDNETEQFCNRAAAEFLVPEEDLRTFWGTAKQSDDRKQGTYQAIARHFKVSEIVGARRALDTDLIAREDFWQFYNSYKDDERRRRRGAQGGGDFWSVSKWRIGSRFAAAVVCAAKEGRLPYREAYALTGLKGDSFAKLSDAMYGKKATPDGLKGGSPAKLLDKMGIKL